MNTIDGPMKIQPINQQPISSVEPSEGSQFSKDLLQAIQDTNEATKKADEEGVKALIGNGSPHEAMIALTEAELKFRMMTQARNKLVEAYREVMRMNM